MDYCMACIFIDIVIRVLVLKLRTIIYYLRILHYCSPSQCNSHGDIDNMINRTATWLYSQFTVSQCLLQFINDIYCTCVAFSIYFSNNTYVCVQYMNHVRVVFHNTWRTLLFRTHMILNAITCVVNLCHYDCVPT